MWGRRQTAARLDGRPVDAAAVGLAVPACGWVMGPALEWGSDSLESDGEGLSGPLPGCYLYRLHGWGWSQAPAALQRWVLKKLGRTPSPNPGCDTRPDRTGTASDHRPVGSPQS